MPKPMLTIAALYHFTRFDDPAALHRQKVARRQAQGRHTAIVGLDRRRRQTLMDRHVKGRLIRAEGPDAAAFLHGQLSQDVTHLGPGEARLAAYCSAKGRMQASALMLRPTDEQVWLVTDASIQPGWLKRLKMFVLRSKVTTSSTPMAARPKSPRDRAKKTAI